jgi:hypothetical protein
MAKATMAEQSLHRVLPGGEMGTVNSSTTSMDPTKQATNLLDLPNEVVLIVRDHIRQEDTSLAALALVNRRTMGLFGEEIFNITSHDFRHLREDCTLATPRFLQTLDRDMCSRQHCARCERLRKRRADDEKRLTWVSNTIPALKPRYFPLPQLDMVTTTMRMLDGAEDEKSIAKLLPNDMASLTGREGGGWPANASFNHAELRFSRAQRCLMLKVETGLEPFEVRDLQNNDQMPAICQHTTWHGDYWFLLLHKANFDRCPAVSNTGIHTDFWEWLSYCDFSKVSADPHKKVAREKYSGLGVVQRCRLCYTQFCLSLTRHPDDVARRVLVFTVWKNLGRGAVSGDNTISDRHISNYGMEFCPPRSRWPYIHYLYELQGYLTPRFDHVVDTYCPQIESVRDEAAGSQQVAREPTNSISQDVCLKDGRE